MMFPRAAHLAAAAALAVAAAPGTDNALAQLRTHHTLLPPLVGATQRSVSGSVFAVPMRGGTKLNTILNLPASFKPGDKLPTR